MLRRVSINVTNLRRLVWMLIALLVLGAGVSLFNLSGFGADPYSCMNMGIGARLGLSFGTWQLILNGILLIIVYFCAKHLIGIATIANMTLIGFTVDLLMPLYEKIHFTADSLFVRILCMLIGVALVSFGTALYARANLGVSPYDAIWYIFTEKSRWNYRVCRIILDCITTSIGFLTGSVVGIGTLITAFFMGPIIGWCNKHICGRLLHVEEYEDETALVK